MSTPSDPFGPRPTSDPRWSGEPGSSGGGYGPPPQAWDAARGPVRPAGPPQTESKAIIALVCAIGSWVLFPFVPAIVALVLAGNARRDIEASGGWLTGEGLVTASRVIAWANIVVSGIVVVLLLLALFAFAGSLSV